MNLTFLGATETVTGSKYLVEYEGKRVLVDCGLFQGDKKLRLRNWTPFPVSPDSIQAIVLTHAHIDHSGYIPRLVKEGFSGPIYCTNATKDLCEILLKDSGYLQEEDARRVNRYGYSKHSPALPLYTKKEAEEALKLFKEVEFGEVLSLNDRLFVTFSEAGHILGAASISISNGESQLFFSGDLGRLHDPVMKAPAPPQECDYLILESTYGNRLHEKEDPLDLLGRVICDTAAKGGSVLIPAFAVGRSQVLLYLLHRLREEGKIPSLPIYLDSPMAINATELFCKYHKYHKLDKELTRAVCEVAKYVRRVEESKRIGSSPFPAVVISASGMATGGRVLHHLKNFLPHSQHTVLFSGFQVHGTRGDRLTQGEREVKIHGEMVPVRARIETLHGASAHADYEETLAWLEGFSKPPKKVFLTHGEPQSALALKNRIKERFGWKVQIPIHRQKESFGSA